MRRPGKRKTFLPAFAESLATFAVKDLDCKDRKGLHQERKEKPDSPTEVICE